MPVPFEIVRRRVIFVVVIVFIINIDRKVQLYILFREKDAFQLATAQNRKRSKTRTTTTKTSAQLSLQSLKDWWKSSAKIDKKTIASLGSACLLSYGFVSNLFYVSSLLLATYTSIKTTGQSPVTSTESLKIFASSYFGLWMIQNVIRPARFAFSVAISPKTDKLVEFFQKYVPGRQKNRTLLGSRCLRERFERSRTCSAASH